MKYFGRTVLAGLALSLAWLKPSFRNQELVSVGFGQIGYSSQNIKSNGFTTCSAVILDFGNDGLMAHAYPSEDIPKSYSYSWENDGFVSADTVVDGLIAEAHGRGLSLDRAVAIVNAGTLESLEQITSDFKHNQIPVVLEGIRQSSGIRNISYNFPKNELSVSSD